MQQLETRASCFIPQASMGPSDIPFDDVQMHHIWVLQICIGICEARHFLVLPLDTGEFQLFHAIVPLTAHLVSACIGNSATASYQ